MARYRGYCCRVDIVSDDREIHRENELKLQCGATLIVLNSLFPVVALIILGVVLRTVKFTDAEYLQGSDRLVYYIFFPLMLFWKIGSSSFEHGVPWALCLAAFAALAIMFAVSIIIIYLFKVPAFEAGSFAQSCYRFNTYIGVAIILNSLGAEGIKYFGVLIGFAIPVINVVAVATLIWFSKDKSEKLHRDRLVIKALLSNPLILGCLAGLLYSKVFSGFPTFLDNSLSLVSMVTLPLALISVGGSLRPSGLKKHLSRSLLASLIKLAVFPVVGYFCLELFEVTGIPFMVGMIFFSLPTSTAIYVLSSQMGSDTELASAAILASTVLSFPVLTLVLLLSVK